MLHDTEVGTTGYGLMGITWRPQQTPNETAFSAVKAALAQGANFWSGGEFCGTPERNSLHLLRDYFEQYPKYAERVFVSIKGAADPKTLDPQGDEAGIRRSVDQCLRMLDGKKKLDMFECARVDPNVPIEESIKVLASYVKEEKLGSISLSETGADSIKRAASVHKISAVEVEFSMFATEILENGVAQTCAELGIPIVAYSPLGRGFLTGQLRKIEDLEGNPILKKFPRFQPGNFEKNLELVGEVEKAAKSKGCTSGQVALAWIKHYDGRQGMPEIIPIFGATNEERVLENLKDVKLTDAEFDHLNEIVKSCTVVGGRYPEAMSHLNFA